MSARTGLTFTPQRTTSALPWAVRASMLHEQPRVASRMARRALQATWTRSHFTSIAPSRPALGRSRRTSRSPFSSSG